MRTAVLAALPLLTGCTCGGAQPTPTSAAPAADEAPADDRERKRERGAGPAPVLRAVELSIPLAPFADADVPALRDTVVAATSEVSKRVSDGSEEVVTEPDRWKCRRARVRPLTTDPSARLTVYERFAGERCEGDVERWWVELDRMAETRPERREKLAGFDWTDVIERRAWSGEGWSPRWPVSLALPEDLGEGDGPFPHDEAWLTAQLPEGAALGVPQTLRSDRWIVAKLPVAGEQLAFELERWTCDDGRPAAATLRYRTHRRQPGHGPRSPKDVTVVPRIQELSRLLVERLGERVAASEGVPTCAP